MHMGNTRVKSVVRQALGQSIRYTCLCIMINVETGKNSLAFLDKKTKNSAKGEMFLPLCF